MRDGGDIHDIRGDGMNSERWDKVKARLREEFGEAAFKSWLLPLAFGGCDDGQVRLEVPTRFMRDWVASHYGERLRVLLTGEDASVRSIDLVVKPSA
ncbi:MAG: hypothetical protein HQL38_11000, partial [Alphaproteobacteria bacterium]|nr:hypothetical protein [Alphaproteobacteria bacterium]